LFVPSPPSKLRVVKVPLEKVEPLVSVATSTPLTHKA
jgi:hypothetical protein